jgi:hypothetical protein
MAPSALASLAKFENEERMHRDNVRQQWWMVWLTLALVTLTAVQLYAHLANRDDRNEEHTVRKTGGSYPLF